MIDLYTVSVLIFFAILGVLIYRDRKKIDFKYILFMRRTKRFSKLLDDIAKKSILFWKIIGTIAFIFCIIFMVYGTWNMIYLARLAFEGFIEEPALAIALPIPSQNTVVGPGFIGIPFWFWIIAVSIILIPHEAMHGIIARSEKIKLKDVGLMLLAIFPGAFVEPDEKQMKKSKLMTKLRIFSAGSFTNIGLGLAIAFLVQALLWAPNVSGVLITSVNETSIANQIGLQPGMIIEKIGNNEATMPFFDYALVVLTTSNSNSDQITEQMSGTIIFNQFTNQRMNETVPLVVNGKSYGINFTEPVYTDLEDFMHDFPHAEKLQAAIGITTRANTKDIGLFYVVFPLLGMIVSLSILVGLFNILPIFPLDGGLIVQALAEKVSKKWSQHITIGITVAMVAIILFTIIVPLL